MFENDILIILGLSHLSPLDVGHDTTAALLVDALLINDFLVKRN